MDLFFKNHNEKYKPENIIRLFFPDIKLRHTRRAGDNYLYFRRGKKRVFIVLIENGVKQTLLTHGDAEKTLYDFLALHTGRVLPWGMLNGVRPLWLYRQRALAGKNHDEISNELATTYEVTQPKIDLLRRCYDTQNAMPINSARDAYSLYVSIPYCPSRCRYCSFISMSANDTAEMSLYLKLLLEEITEISRTVTIPPLTVYVGGGTPSVLSAEQLRRLLNHINELFRPTQEFTVEAGRPDCTDREKLKVLKEYGVGRISINPQTFNDATLLSIGRLHSASDIYRCFNEARELGHDNINMDLISGLPNDSLEGFNHSLRETIKLAPNSITVHSFTQKTGSHLSQEHLAPWPDVAMMAVYRDEMMEQNDYNPYYIYRQKKTPSGLENVGYSQRGYECLYNVYMMDELHGVISAGAGGVTKFVSGERKIIREFHSKYPKEYINDRIAAHD